ncbi:MAG: hypothetical protein FWD58_03425 [Firmicutes bacterium]|nr:hypothetical protein [Bacillota bacterium]
MGLLSINDLVLDGIDLTPKRTCLFVEGPDDEAWIGKFIELFGADGSRYQFIKLTGATNAEKYFEVAAALGIKYKVIIDDDQNGAPNMTAMLERLKLCKAQIVFVGKGLSPRSLEGLFTGRDKFEYMTGGKAVAKNIVRAFSLTQFEQQTIENFRKLLLEIGIRLPKEATQR